MKIPVNGQITIKKDVWTELEALRRFYGEGTHKSVLEAAISDVVSGLLSNPDFAVTLQAVRKEGVTRGKGRKGSNPDE
jgi:hypothetical protein